MVVAPAPRGRGLAPRSSPSPSYSSTKLLLGAGLPLATLSPSLLLALPAAARGCPYLWELQSTCCGDAFCPLTFCLGKTRQISPKCSGHPFPNLSPTLPYSAYHLHTPLPRPLTLSLNYMTVGYITHEIGMNV